jgi:hypothetical protein
MPHLSPYNEHWTMSVANNRVRCASHQCSSYSTPSSASHHYQSRSYVLSHLRGLFSCASHFAMSLCYSPSISLDLPHVLIEQLPSLMVQLGRLFLCVGYRHRYDRSYVRGPDIARSSSYLLYATTVRAAKAASSEPSVASRILVGKMLIVRLLLSLIVACHHRLKLRSGTKRC